MQWDKIKNAEILSESMSRKSLLTWTCGLCYSDLRYFHIIESSQHLTNFVRWYDIPRWASFIRTPHLCWKKIHYLVLKGQRLSGHVGHLLFFMYCMYATYASETCLLFPNTQKCNFVKPKMIHGDPNALWDICSDALWDFGRWYFRSSDSAPPYVCTCLLIISEVYLYLHPVVSWWSFFFFFFFFFLSV